MPAIGPAFYGHQLKPTGYYPNPLTRYAPNLLAGTSFLQVGAAVMAPGAARPLGRMEEEGVITGAASYGADVDASAVMRAREASATAGQMQPTLQTSQNFSDLFRLVLLSASKLTVTTVQTLSLLTSKP